RGRGLLFFWCVRVPNRPFPGCFRIAYLAIGHMPLTDSDPYPDLASQFLPKGLFEDREVVRLAYLMGQELMGHRYVGDIASGTDLIQLGRGEPVVIYLLGKIDPQEGANPLPNL